MSLQNYLRAVDEAWNDYDGDALATYLSFQDHHVTNPKLQVENPESQVEQNLDNPIDEIGNIFVSLRFYVKSIYSLLQWLRI